MMNFMREGGFAMWLLLVTAIGALALAFSLAREKRAGVLRATTVLLILESILGISAGMKAVAAYTARPAFATLPDQAATVAQGLAELANNGILGAGLVLIVWIAALVTGRAATR